MKQELKDYLHLYIGCEAELTYDTESFVKVMTCDHVKKCCGRDDWMKPILRPLSDMTEMEIIKLLTIVYKDIYNYTPDIGDCTFHKEGLDSVGMKCLDRLDDSVLGFSIQVMRGIEYSTNGTYSVVNQFKCTHWLLEHGFDLFGLIEANLAINRLELVVR